MSWNDVNLKMDLLAMYYHTRRGVGHTHAVLHGAINVPGTIVLVKDHSQKLWIHNRVLSAPVKMVTFDEIEHRLLREGSPMVIDPWALDHVWRTVRDAVTELQKENSMLRDQIHSLNMELERRKHGDYIVNQWRKS
jgi:hypothetical protein